MDYSEFARLPESGTTRYEIIDDELVVTPAPSLHHQRIAGRLFAELFGFVEEHRLGEVFPAPLDVLFAEGDDVLRWSPTGVVTLAVDLSELFRAG